MANKKKNDISNTLPQNVDSDTEQSSSITYANDVVAIIAGLAANEVEGIAGMSGPNGSILNKNRNITKGVKVEVGTEEVSVDLYVTVEYGTPIQRAAHDAQESVKKAIESMTGLHVVRVDVHVQSVSFEKEISALQAGAQNAILEAGNQVQNNSEPAKEESSDTSEQFFAQQETESPVEQELSVDAGNEEPEENKEDKPEGIE